MRLVAAAGVWLECLVRPGDGWRDDPPRLSFHRTVPPLASLNRTMALVIVTDHLPALLKPVISYLQTLTIHLFQNDHVPAAGDTVADYVEADFAGYVPHELSAWGKVYLNNDNKGEVDHPNIHFYGSSAGPANPIYGYYVTDQSYALVWAERNPGGPVVVPTDTQLYVVAPTFTSGQC